MSKLSVYEKVYTQLFEPKKKTKLTEAEQRVKDRCLAIYTKKINDPLIRDKELVNFLTETFDISQSQAYYDISNMERLFGNFRKANKEYIRHIVTETQKKVIQEEMRRLEADESGKYSSKDLSYAVKVLAQANNLDKEDPETPDWESVQPPIPLVSDDVTILDLKNVQEENIEKLRAKYKEYIEKDSQDAEIINDSE